MVLMIGQDRSLEQPMPDLLLLLLEGFEDLGQDGRKYK
jgi:hypothetical protein